MGNDSEHPLSLITNGSANDDIIQLLTAAPRFFTTRAPVALKERTALPIQRSLVQFQLW